MRLLSRLALPGPAGRTIELVQGDLSVPDPQHPFDLLVVSAFPNDYAPVPGTLIGALDDQGLSVIELAEAKALELRTHFSCWLSRDVAAAGLGFRRLLCFEPLVRGKPPEVVGDIFRALMPVLGEVPGLHTVAMPVVAAGNAGWAIEAMLRPLLDAALHWLAVGLPLQTIKIAVYTDADAAQARPVLEAFRATLPAPPPARDDAAFDLFLSYARRDARHVDRFEAELRRVAPATRVFLDRREIEVGESWQPEIFESIDRCRRVVAMLSPWYVASKVCKEEFNLAWARGRETGREILFPVYLYSAELPTYMASRTFADCREGSQPRLAEASRLLAELLRRGG